VIVVELPRRGTISWDGPDDVVVEVDLTASIDLTNAGSRGLDRLRELQDGLEADVDRVLGQAAYADGFDRILADGSARHARAALLSLSPDAEITYDDEDDVEAVLRQTTAGVPAERAVACLPTLAD